MNEEDKMRRFLEGARGSNGDAEMGWESFAGRAHRTLAVRRTVIGAGIAIVVFAALAGAAALRPEGIREPNVAPATQPPEDSVFSPRPSPTAPAEEPVRFTTIELWYVKDERLLHERMPVQSTPAIGRLAMQMLLSGVPGPVLETVPGVSTAIPRGTEVLDLHIADGLATVDLSSEYESGGGSLSIQLRVAQVVFTLTQFDTVEAVRFRIDGHDVESIGGEGLLVDKPQKRKHFEDVAPPIIVEDPQPGDRVPSTFTMIGTANVFEATVSYRVVDDEGNELADGFTTATCGSGCRGDFSAKIRTEVNRRTPATLEVFESSAEDGRPLHMVRVPITLTP